MHMRCLGDIFYKSGTPPDDWDLTIFHIIPIPTSFSAWEPSSSSSGHLQWNIASTTTLKKKIRDCPTASAGKGVDCQFSSSDSRRLFLGPKRYQLFPGPKRYQCSVSVTSGTPLPSPQSDATTIMIAILYMIVVVMIASVTTNLHACSSARGDTWPANLSMRLLREPRKL